MIKLMGFGESFGVADPSPFVLKVNAYMTMSGIEFQTFGGLSALKNAPKGKLPYIDDNGKIIADSFFILKHLQSNYDSPLDQPLTDEQRAISNLIVKSLDENFYWCIVHSRWVRDDTWPIIKQRFFGEMPFPLAQIVPFVARRGVKSALMKQGLSKHSDEEILVIAKDTLTSLSALLGDKRYMWGDNPTTLDAIVYAFVAQVTLIELDNPLIRLGREYKNLVDYCQRIKQQYYGN